MQLTLRSWLSDSTGEILVVKELRLTPQRVLGSSALDRGHEHHRAIRRFRVCEGRPRRLGGVQRGGGT